MSDVALPTVEPEVKKPKRQRLVDIDHLKAIAIVLVVFGHVVAREAPRGNEWYSVAKNTLYLFHMPLFMFVSGVILAYTYKPFESAHDYFRYAGQRIARLAPAYLILALIIVVGKMAATKVMHVDNAPTQLSDILLVLTRPYDSATAFLWYVYVLLMYYLTVPPLMRLVGKRVEILLLIGLGLYFLPRTSLFGLGQYCEYFFFVSLGVVASTRLEALRGLADRGFAAWTALFVALCAGFGYAVAQNMLHDVAVEAAMLVFGTAAIPFFVGLARRVAPAARPTLETLAKYTFTIYLFNTLFIGLVKGVGTKKIPWDGLNFLVYLPVLWLAGLCLPILLHRYILSRVGPLGKITI